MLSCKLWFWKMLSSGYMPSNTIFCGATKHTNTRGQAKNGVPAQPWSGGSRLVSRLAEAKFIAYRRLSLVRSKVRGSRAVVKFGNLKRHSGSATG